MTCMFEKSPTCVKWDTMYMRKETYICEKIPTYVKIDPIYVRKETYICQKRTIHVTRDLHMWKETYICKKRDLHMQIYKNTCDFFLVVSLHLYSTWLLPVKIDLYMWKETYICEKRPYIYLSSSVLDVTPPHVRDIWGSYD